MCQLLDATKLPHILIYRREGGQVAKFKCLPSKIHRLTDALHEHALPSAVDQILEEECSIDSEEIEIEQILAEGVELMQDVIPELLEEALSIKKPLSFAEYLAERDQRNNDL